MNIKLDENLPLRLATLLKGLGHDVHTLHDELLLGHADREIWEATQKESRFLLWAEPPLSSGVRISPGGFVWGLQALKRHARSQDQ
jgi:Domain of unknown function (DUF5615)